MTNTDTQTIVNIFVEIAHLQAVLTLPAVLVIQANNRYHAVVLIVTLNGELLKECV